LNLELSQGCIATHFRRGGCLHSTFPQESYGEKIL